jgi:hypothetical protein
MMGEFDQYYLRYVDDTFLVVPKSDVEHARIRLHQALDLEGLKPNHDKEDIVSGKVWNNENPLNSTFDKKDEFHSLMEDIAIYLLNRPTKLSELQVRFREDGFSLPLNRAAQMSNSPRFWKFFGFGARISGWIRSWFVSEKHLLEKANALRNRLWWEAVRLADVPPPITSLRRRWWVQKRRYVLNRLLYLLSPKEYKPLIHVTPDENEFAEFRVLLNALIGGNATAILSYPGSCVTTFCQLWPEHHPGKTPRVDWPKNPTPHQAEAVMHLSLFLSVVPTPEFLAAVEKTNPNNRLMIDCLSCVKVRSNSVPSAPYYEEIESLIGEFDHQDLIRMISTRYHELEDFGLDGISIRENLYTGSFEFPIFSA